MRESRAQVHNLTGKELGLIISCPMEICYPSSQEDDFR